MRETVASDSPSTFASTLLVTPKRLAALSVALVRTAGRSTAGADLGSVSRRMAELLSVEMISENNCQGKKKGRLLRRARLPAAGHLCALRPPCCCGPRSPSFRRPFPPAPRARGSAATRSRHPARRLPHDGAPRCVRRPVADAQRQGLDRALPNHRASRRGAQGALVPNRRRGGLLRWERAHRVRPAAVPGAAGRDLPLRLRPPRARWPGPTAIETRKATLVSLLRSCGPGLRLVEHL